MIQNPKSNTDAQSSSERKTRWNQNEAFSRVLIDKALEFSGWDLLDPRQVVFELHTGAGRADYLLKDKLGRTLCVLEAKRENLDPYDAKEQARGYRRRLV
jgi:predicted type IV restriction endonuclease